MIKLLASLKKLIGRYKDYMAPALIAVASTMVMVGFIFWSDPNRTDELMPSIAIITGIVIMAVSLFVVRHEEREDRKHNQALLLYLITISRKQGVNMNDIKEARQMIDIIDKANRKNKNLSLSDMEILMNKKSTKDKNVQDDMEGKP